MAANGAQYGVATVNYYWIGAIPAMVFLGLVMMPFYYGSKVRSVPEYLLQRFNSSSHKFNSWTFAIAHDPDRRREPVRARARPEVPARAGRSSSASSSRRSSSPPTSPSAACRRAIYNEVLQFFVILAALIPISIVGLHDVGGWGGLQDKITDSQDRRGGPARPAGHQPRRRDQPDRGVLDRDRVRPRVRARVRLLDDELRRGPARALGQGPVAPPSARR